MVLNVQTYAENAVNWLVLYPYGQAQPPTASMLWNPWTPVTNHIIVPVDPTTGEINMTEGPAAGGTQVSIGVEGWFTDNSNPSAAGSLYYPNNGTLVCDTIANTNTPCSGGGQVTAGTALPVQLTGLGGVPSGDPGLLGVELSLTVTNVSLPQTTPPTGTYLCVYPSDGSCQGETDLNLYGGVPANLLVIVPLGPTGAVNIYTPTGSMDVLVAVTGYYDSETVTPAVLDANAVPIARCSGVEGIGSLNYQTVQGFVNLYCSEAMQEMGITVTLNNITANATAGPAVNYCGRPNYPPCGTSRPPTPSLSAGASLPYVQYDTYTYKWGYDEYAPPGQFFDTKQPPPPGCYLFNANTAESCAGGNSYYASKPKGG